MNKFIKLLALVLVISTLCATFASCSGKKASDNTNTDAGTNNDAINDTTNDSNNNGNTQGGDQGDTDEESFSLEATKKDGRGEASSIPNFTERQIKNQKIMGASIVEEIREAASDLSRSSFTIPPGDYGFDMNTVLPNTHMRVPSAFALDGIHRPDDNPFTIYAEGVTFWTENAGEPCGATGYAFIIRNCSNIKVVGLTVDEYKPNDIEGEVTAIDKVNNRIAIKLTNSSMEVNEEIIKKGLAGTESRIVPFKSDGRMIAPLYNITPGGWGPGSMKVKNITPTDNEDEYWLTFTEKTLLETITSADWISTYGSDGIIEEGDVLSFIYGIVMVNLVNSKQIVMERFTSHLTKGCPGEDGGYGGHVWKDCYFGPRPGSSKVMSLGETLFNGTRVGTTFDNVTIAASSDDQINIHGYISKIASINGKTLNLNYVQIGGLAGDVAEFYSNDGKLIDTRTLAEDVSGGNFLDRTVKFTEDVPESYKDYFIRWPSQECNGWTIKNCSFFNNYQRILLQAGSGTFENNKVYNMGHSMTISNDFRIYIEHNYEGGIIGDVAIKNNVFINSSTSPKQPLFNAMAAEDFDGVIYGESLTITGNLFIGCGYFMQAKNFKAINVSDNIVIEPKSLGLKADDFSDLFLSIDYIDKMTIKNNSLYGELLEEGAGKGSNKNHSITNEFLGRIRFYAENTNEDAAKIIKTVKVNLGITS